MFHPWQGVGARHRFREPLRVEIMSDFTAVSYLLDHVIARAVEHLPRGEADVELADDLRLALAEALNNSVEHGYAGRAPGPVRVDLRRPPGRVVFHVRDRGVALPRHLLKPPPPPDPLAERGRGWYLIHRLTDRVRYERRNGWNRLTLERLF